MTTLDSIIAITPEVLSQDVQGESVLLHLGTESYYGLNAVGARLWQRLQTGLTLRTIHGLMLREYLVEAARLEQDLITLVDELQQAGLVQIAPPGSARD